MPPEQQDKSPSAEQVGTRTRRGISWNFGGAVVTNGMRVVVLAVLGRVLSSHDFGIVAAAVLVNVVVFGIRDIGLGPALVQRKDLAPEHLTTVFAMSTYIGAFLSAALFITAPLIGELWGILDSVNVIRALALLFAIRSVATTSRMMCQREMNFRAIAIIDAASFTIGSIVAMVTAIYGAGPWALVAGYTVEEVLSTGLYLRLRPPRVSLRIERSRLKELLSFGGWQTIGQIFAIGATYGDNFIVGGALGARDLGYYTRAYDLIRFPSLIFDAIVGNVLFPAFSRLQDDPERLAMSFRRVMFASALLLLPASAAVIIVAPEAIRVLMGTQWGEAVLPFQILATTIFLRTSQKGAAIVTQAAGGVRGIAVAMAVYTVFVIGGGAISIQWGIVGIATSTAIAITVVSVHTSMLALRASKLRSGSWLAAHGPGLVLAAIVVVVAWPLAQALRHAELPAWLILVIVGVSAVTVCLGVLWIWLRRANGDFEWLRSEVVRLRPPPPPP
ncbi:MAG: polysaccharide biosynthesis protein [Deltaproteobacteria bacterium]|nr:polysaccharide biosynthesis protein [Deltaproteobacteria bacterium]